MDRFDEMQSFVRVVESGGISAAAERLGLAKSAVSRRLQELENRLGVQLLQRTTRRISLTEAGRRFYERCLRILDELEEAEQSLSSEQQQVHGLLRVAAPLSFTLRHLMPIFNEFMYLYPEVRLDLDVEDRQINLLEEGVDLAIRIGRLDDSSLVARRLAPVQTVLCASPDYLTRYGLPRRPEDLNRHLGLNYGHLTDQRQWTLFDRKGMAHSVRPRMRMRANNGDVLLQAALAGLGIAVMPTFICHRELAEGRLQPLLDDYSAEQSAAYALYPSRRHLPLRVRVFIDFIAERLGERPPWDALA
ncbi:MAG: LysR family transcriptional regulator [Pseudomonadota bacterium]